MNGRNFRGRYGTNSAYDRFLQYDEPLKTATYHDFSGGVCTSSFSRKKNVAAAICNMQIENGRLISMPAPGMAQCDSGFDTGAIGAQCYDGGTWLFQKGKTLYAEQNGEFFCVGEPNMLVSEESAIYAMEGDFYVIDEERILRVTKDLLVSEVEQYIPTYYREVSADGTTWEAAEEMNPFCSYIDIVLSNESSPIQTIPPELAIDPEYIDVWDPYGNHYGPPQYTFDGETIRFWDSDARQFRIRLKLLPVWEEGKISFSTMAPQRDLIRSDAMAIELDSADFAYLSYGGKSGKTLMIWRLAGAQDFGYLSQEKAVMTEYREEITAVVPYSDGYLIFSDSAVKKMMPIEDEQGMLHISFANFKQDFGSDMPGSVCGFDDKILFAHSCGGVYFINKFGVFERDASRHISANIESGSNGFFAHTVEEYHEACATCAFGKYHLTVGDMTYIWDYGAGLPSATPSHSDEERMVWTMMDAVRPAVYGEARFGKLYYMERETNTLAYLCYAQGEEESMPACLKTMPSDLGDMKEKALCGLRVRYCASKDVTLTLFCDDVPLPCQYTLPATENVTSLSIPLYQRRFVKFAVSLSSKNSFVLEAITIAYI